MLREPLDIDGFTIDLIDGADHGVREGDLVGLDQLEDAHPALLFGHHMVLHAGVPRPVHGGLAVEGCNLRGRRSDHVPFL